MVPLEKKVKKQTNFCGKNMSAFVAQLAKRLPSFQVTIPES